MAELKTQRTGASVPAFLDTIADEGQRADARAIGQMLEDLTGDPPEMWGPAIVGYGIREATYANGKKVDWMKAGFSPRKSNLTVYLPGGFDRLAAELARLGKHKTGMGCLYIRRLSDIDIQALRDTIAKSLESLTD